MVPIHYDTLVNGFDAPGEARATLARVVKERGLGDDRVRVLPIGGQAVIVPATESPASPARGPAAPR